MAEEAAGPGYLVRLSMPSFIEVRGNVNLNGGDAMATNVPLQLGPSGGEGGGFIAVSFQGVSLEGGTVAVNGGVGGVGGPTGGPSGSVGGKGGAGGAIVAEGMIMTFPSNSLLSAQGGIGGSPSQGTILGGKGGRVRINAFIQEGAGAIPFQMSSAVDVSGGEAGLSIDRSGGRGGDAGSVRLFSDYPLIVSGSILGAGGQGGGSGGLTGGGNGGNGGLLLADSELYISLTGTLNFVGGRGGDAASSLDAAGDGGRGGDILFRTLRSLSTGGLTNSAVEGGEPGAGLGGTKGANGTIEPPLNP